MKEARVLLPDNTYAPSRFSGGHLLVPASKFKTKEQARAYLLDNFGEAAKYCCPHGTCKACVDFRKASEKVNGEALDTKITNDAAGDRVVTRTEAWTSRNVGDHEPNCEGPVEFNFEHLPHNGLTLTQAVQSPTEIILINLNIDTGEKGFIKRGEVTEAKTWREENPTSHSYFSTDSLDDLSAKVAKVFDIAGIDGLKRIKIAHEGKLTDFSNFFMRNTAESRFRLIEGNGDNSGLLHRPRKSFMKVVYGDPRLMMLECPQPHQKITDAVRGYRYQEKAGQRRTVMDQVYLKKTGLKQRSLCPNGGLILGIPFIYPDNGPYMVHWAVQSAENFQPKPNPTIEKILCWAGMRRPR